MPTISIIIPVYKVESYIRRCIDSVLNQTLTDFELILVDDGSPDNCGNICDEYAEKDNRVHVIHKENGGLSDARNAGIEWVVNYSVSEWITFVDSDDWVHPKYLEVLYTAVLILNCNVSICRFEETTGYEPEIDKSLLVAEVVNTEKFFCEHNVNAVVAWGKLYKKDFFKNIRYPVGKIHEDEFTTYKLLFKTETCAFVNQPLYYYFYNPKSITESQWTPKRMDVVEALFQNIVFFGEHGITDAYIHQIKNQGKNIWFQYEKLKIYPQNKVSSMWYLRKSMRKLLRISKGCRLLSVKSFPQYHKFAFPIKYKIYTIAAGVKHKLTTLK